MSALRVARAATRREKVIKFEGCYHGHADAFLVQAGSGALTLGVPTSPGVPQGAAADTLVALLRYGWGRPWRDELLSLLPSSGEGTLSRRLAGNDRVFAKTGSMTGIYNIAGYVLPAEGEPLAFALMSNGVVRPGDEVRARQDAALHLLAQRAPEPPRVGCLGRRAP